MSLAISKPESDSNRSQKGDFLTLESVSMILPEIDKMIKRTERLIDSVDVSAREQKKKIDKNISKINEEIENNKNEIKRIKVDFIAVMGVFVSIFTFISIEIQILKYVCDFFRIAGFSLIIFGSLAGFMILLYSIFGQRKNQWRLWFLCFIPFLLGIVIGSGSVPFFKRVDNSCIISSEDFSKFEKRLEKLETPVKIEQENIKETSTTP